MDVEEKIRELSQRVEKLEEENKKLKKRNRQLQGPGIENAEESSKISRRKFLKMLGVGAGGLALSSSVAGLTWSKITPRIQGTSGINAEIASGLKSSVVGDGLKNGQSSALSVEPSDFAGSGLQDDGNDNLTLSNDSISISADDGLDGGGSVALGESTSLSVNVSDFAGTGLQDDGSNDLSINSNFFSFSVSSPNDLSDSRSFGTTYTNNTGNPIFLSVISTENSFGNVDLELKVDGVRVDRDVDTNTDEMLGNVEGLVPNGSTYTVNDKSIENYGVSTWVEQEMSL